MNADSFRDPFLGFILHPQLEAFRIATKLVLFTDATYIVICPGVADKLATIAREACSVWKNTPFVVDSEDLAIVMRLVTDEYMRLDRGEAIPAILEYDGTNHVVDFGRGSPLYTVFVLTTVLAGMETSNYYNTSSVIDFKWKARLNTQ